MRTSNYTFEFKPNIAKYIFREMYLNEHKKEPEILKGLIKGKTCEQIGNEIGYSQRTIERRRQELYKRTKDFMF